MGRVVTPSGEVIQGLSVTIDDGLPPAKLDYTTERITELLGSKPTVTKLSNTNLIITT